MLLGAERPVIFVGQAVRHGGAAEELLKLAERLQIPVAASMSGLGASTPTIRSRSAWSRAAATIRPTTPRVRPTYCCRSALRFDDRTSSSWIPGYSFTIPPTKLIHVDIDPDEIGRNYPVALA